MSPFEPVEIRRSPAGVLVELLTSARVLETRVALPGGGWFVVSALEPDLIRRLAVPVEQPSRSVRALLEAVELAAGSGELMRLPEEWTRLGVVMSVRRWLDGPLDPELLERDLEAAWADVNLSWDRSDAPGPDPAGRGFAPWSELPPVPAETGAILAVVDPRNVPGCSLTGRVDIGDGDVQGVTFEAVRGADLPLLAQRLVARCWNRAGAASFRRFSVASSGLGLGLTTEQAGATELVDVVDLDMAPGEMATPDANGRDELWQLRRAFNATRLAQAELLADQHGAAVTWRRPLAAESELLRRTRMQEEEFAREVEEFLLTSLSVFSTRGGATDGNVYGAGDDAGHVVHMTDDAGGIRVEVPAIARLRGRVRIRVGFRDSESAWSDWFELSRGRGSTLVVTSQSVRDVMHVAVQVERSR